MQPAGSGTETSMTENFYDRNEGFDLNELNFVFGIEGISPALGRIEAYAISQPRYRLKDEQRIDLVSCRDLIDSADDLHSEMYNKLVTSQTRDAHDYLCPNVTSMLLQGDTKSVSDFRYIKLVVKGCNIGEGCVTGVELQRRLGNQRLEFPMA